MEARNLTIYKSFMIATLAKIIANKKNIPVEQIDTQFISNELQKSKQRENAENDSTGGRKVISFEQIKKASEQLEKLVI